MHETKSQNSGDHEIWNHEMRGPPVYPFFNMCFFTYLLWYSPRNQGTAIVSMAWMYPQPHYDNGVFSNVYLSAGQH